MPMAESKKLADDPRIATPFPIESKRYGPCNTAQSTSYRNIILSRQSRSRGDVMAW